MTDSTKHSQYIFELEKLKTMFQEALDQNEYDVMAITLSYKQADKFYIGSCL